MENQNSFPYNFDGTKCKTCGGRCCRGPSGYVWITIDEIEKIAGLIKMEVPLFFKQYVRHAQNRLALQERVINDEHLCCFFDPCEVQCSIYQSRPEQCRTFPFWDRFREYPQEIIIECPGISLKKAAG